MAASPTIRELERTLACIRILEEERRAEARAAEMLREAEAERLMKRETSMGKTSWAWRHPVYEKRCKDDSFNGKFKPEDMWKRR